MPKLIEGIEITLHREREREGGGERETKSQMTLLKVWFARFSLNS
jgi:hypothetical protein